MIRTAVLAEMQRRHWSQSDLARESGVTQPKLSRWLSGAGSISMANAERVLKSVGLRLTRGKHGTNNDR